MAGNLWGMNTRFQGGAKHPNRDGGCHYNKEGYKQVLVKSNTYIAEQILVMEWHLRRSLQRNEIVHHINENRSDNRLENLQLMTRAEHSSLHNSGRKVSEETKKKLRLIRAGTNQKEVHQQWESNITKEKILECINKHKRQKDVAKALGICPDTLRARMKYYQMGGWHGRDK